MSEALALQANSLPADRAPTLEEFAAALGLSVGQAASALTTKDALQAIHETTKARALLAQGPIINRLIRIANEGDDKEAMTAASLLLKLSGNIKGPSVNVTLSFDELMKGAAAQAGPLSSLTHIVESRAIDADDDGELDNDNQ
jgi:hypothetical protein